MSPIVNKGYTGALMKTYDFIVVGGGIAGGSIAYELARTGRVCLLEAEARPGFHATGRSAALFAPTYGGKAIRAVTRASRAFFNQPPPGFCEHPLLQPRGCLYIARTDQQDRLESTMDSVRASGGHVTLVTDREASVLVPLFREGYVARAALDSDAMDIDVEALQQGFMRGARAAGATIRSDSRVDKVQRRDGLWTVDVSDGHICAPVLINAAGAWADEVAELCGARRIGLEPLRRTALLVDPPAGVDVRRWPAVVDADEMFYFKPDAGKLLVSPADETPDKPGDVQPDDLDVAVGVDRVQGALDIDVRRVSHSWAGLRTFSPDRTPVVGFDPQMPGLFWCAGQGGYGIQSAPALARTAAALARRDSVPADVAAEGLQAADLSPGRFVS
jgi:D-arginine dehydrogenase